MQQNVLQSFGHKYNHLKNHPPITYLGLDLFNELKWKLCRLLRARVWHGPRRYPGDPISAQSGKRAKGPLGSVQGIWRTPGWVAVCMAWQGMVVKRTPGDQSSTWQLPRPAELSVNPLTISLPASSPFKDTKEIELPLFWLIQNYLPQTYRGTPGCKKTKSQLNQPRIERHFSGNPTSQIDVQIYWIFANFALDLPMSKNVLSL